MYEPTLEAAERHQVPVFLLISGDLPLVRPIVERHPELNLVIDHLGIRQPPMDERDVPPFRSLPDLLALAKYPNVAVKVCGVPALSEAGVPYDDVWPFVDQIFEAFGSDRLVWGSDIPRFQQRISWGHMAPSVRGPYVGEHSYMDVLDLFRNSSQLTLGEKQRLLGGNLRRLLEWPAMKAEL